MKTTACPQTVGHSPSPLESSAQLYRRHWSSLCAFARARGCELHDAEDAVQELFAKLVAQGQDERAAAISDPGEQAAFLLARLRTHLIKRWKHRTRLRRGGGMSCLSLTSEEGAEWDVLDQQATPDAALDRCWARQVLDQALERMSAELQAQGREDLWGCLEHSMTCSVRHERPLPGALRVALHRARRRLRILIQTQLQADDLEQLRAALS